MKNEEESNKKIEIDQVNKLEGYEKTNADLTTINNIEELKENKEKYQRINLSHNKLFQIKELFIFPKLVYLDLSFNYLEKLTNFYPLKDLEVLILANNFIRNINTNLFPLKKLQHLDLSNNHLDMSNNATINALKENTELKSLLLKGNDNYNYEQIKYLCLDNLKKINFLDAIKIAGNKNNKNVQKAYINVHGIKGNQKKISTLNEYIKFKFNDYNDNKKDYEDNMKNNQQKNDDNIKELENGIKSSYYFLKYSSSC